MQGQRDSLFMYHFWKSEKVHEHRKEALVVTFALGHLSLGRWLLGLVMSHKATVQTSCAPEPTCRLWGAACMVPLSFLDLEGRWRLSTATDLWHLIIPSACSIPDIRSWCLWCQSGILGESAQMLHGSSALSRNIYFSGEFWRDAAVLVWDILLAGCHWIPFWLSQCQQGSFSLH